MIKIGIVDDHESIRDSYTKALEQQEDFSVVGSLSSAALADIWCRQADPDVVLMDICTEGGASGLEATAAIKKSFPHIKIVVMTGFDEISYIPRAKEAGADGFVYKSRSFDYLIYVLREVMEGRKIFPEPQTIPMPKGEAPLTEREMEILRLICKNCSRKEIAEQLYLSENTVKRHIANMLEKTSFSSTMALAVYMVSGGWINPNF